MKKAKLKMLGVREEKIDTHREHRTIAIGRWGRGEIFEQFVLR